jgi:electron transfer flavoprotein alpha/beta subunit
MNTGINSKADLIEHNAVGDVERARQRALEQATALRDRMARLVAQMEADPADASPTAGSGALQYGADLERALQEWACKRDTLRLVRLVRRATEPAPAPGNTSGG